MKDDKMKLSIIVPAYNAEKYIGRCLDSILAEQEDTFEVIVINDGSKDNTKKVVQKKLEQDTRLILVDKENEGVSVARNTGIKKAKGKYIAFIDADDIFLENGVRTMLDFIENVNEKKGIIGIYNYQEIDAEGTVLRKINLKQILQDENGVLECYISSFQMNTCWAKIFEKSIIDVNSIEFPKGVKIGEDTVFMGKYLQYVSNFILLDVYIYGYRQLSEGTMNTQRATISDQYLSDIEKAFSVKYEIYKKNMDNNRGRYLYYNKISEFIIATLNLAIKTDKKFNEKSCELKKLLENPFVKKNLKEAIRVSEIKTKRKIVINMLRSKILRDIYIWTKEVEWYRKG